ncbi:MAG: acyltransferase family protein, partial [Thermocrispum sp.]
LLALVALAARGTQGVHWDHAVPPVVRRPIKWLAGISYGVYLMHQQLGFVLARVLAEHGVPGWARLLAVLAAAVAAGWLLTVLVERPAHRLLTQVRGRPSRNLSGAAPSMGGVG